MIEKGEHYFDSGNGGKWYYDLHTDSDSIRVSDHVIIQKDDGTTVEGTVKAILEDSMVIETKHVPEALASFKNIENITV